MPSGSRMRRRMVSPPTSGRTTSAARTALRTRSTRACAGSTRRTCATCARRSVASRAPASGARAATTPSTSIAISRSCTSRSARTTSPGWDSAGMTDGPGAVGDLVAAPPAQTPYDIVRTAWAELAVLDLAASEQYYVDVLGLIVSARAPGALYLRGWEERLHHSLVLREGPVAGLRRLAFRVREEADLDALAADFAARGCETEDSDGEHPGTGRALHVRDPFGFPLAFFHEMEQFDTQLQRFDLQRGAPVARIDHFNLHT